MGSRLAKMPEFQDDLGKLKASLPKCFFEHKWVSKEFCSELMNLDPEGESKLVEALSSKYPQDLIGAFTSLLCGRGWSAYYQHFSVFVAMHLPSLANAEGKSDNFQLGPALMVCSSYYSGFEGTPLGSHLAKMLEFQEEVEKMKASAPKCFFEHKWVSEEFCSELMNLDPEGEPKLVEVLTSRYPQDIHGAFASLVCDKVLSKYRSSKKR